MNWNATRSCSRLDSDPVAELLPAADAALRNAVAVPRIQVLGTEVDRMRPVAEHVVDRDEHWSGR